MAEKKDGVKTLDNCVKTLDELQRLQWCSVTSDVDNKENGPSIAQNALSLISKALHKAGKKTITFGVISGSGPLKTCGNSSVAHGFAQWINQPQVNILNVGSGGQKYQPYTKNTTGYTVGKELKPGNENKNFHDKHDQDLSDEECLVLKREAQALCGGELDKLDNVYVLITGPCRTRWEKGGDDKKKMEERAEKVYGGWAQKADGKSFFISQETEGKAEFVACQKMYESYSAVDKTIRQAMTCPNYASMGVGGSSFQLAIGEKVFTIKAGMNTRWTGDQAPLLVALENQMADLVQFVPDECFIILKSGFVLKPLTFLVE